MSRTNVFTLVATILLGILLFTILRFEGSLPEPPPADSIRETTTVAPITSTDPEGSQARSGNLPRISTHLELLSFLGAQGVAAQPAIANSAMWFQQRGFPASNPLFAITEDEAVSSAREDLFISVDSESVSSGAQALAAQVAFTDPFYALDLYRIAADRGSVYAIQRIAALLEALEDESLDDYVADPDYLRKLGELRGQNSNRNPKFPALSHVLAAVRDGGPPIIDEEILQWMQRLSSEFSAAERSSACERSAQLFLEFGAKRRQNGLNPISTRPPPVFLSVPELEKRLPCRTTSYPIIQLLDLSQCSRTPVQDSRGDRMELNICRNE